MRASLSGVVVFLGLLLSAMGLSGCARSTATEQQAMAEARQDKSAYVLPPARLSEAESYSATRTVFHLGDEIWGIAVLIGLLQSRTVARMRNLAVNLSKNRWSQGALFWLQLLIVLTLFGLPFRILQQHANVAYGLSVQGWGGWVWDQIKGLVLTYLFGLLGMMLLFLIIRRFPKRWWVGAWLAMVGVVLLGIFVTPYVIDPLFNRFEPLSQSNPALVAQLEKVVARGHGISIPPERMFLMKASAKVTTLNAYVTGFGASKRVVVWDTSLAKGTPDEISFIFGHEMGHYVLGHIVRGVEESVVLLLVGSLLSYFLLQWLLRVYGKRWRIPSQDNWAALPLLMLIVAVLSFVSEPLVNTLSRQMEHEADVYGLEVIHGIVPDPQTTGQKTFDLLGDSSLSTPDPAALTVLWDYSHPPIAERASFAKHYNPWTPGATPRYFPK